MAEKERLLYYNITPVQYQAPSSIVVDQYCNGVTVINIGVAVMTVNGIPLNPGTPGTNNGESYSFGGNKGEIFSGAYRYWVRRWCWPLHCYTKKSMYLN